MNLDLGLLARALIARVMLLEAENAALKQQLAEARSVNDVPSHPDS